MSIVETATALNAVYMGEFDYNAGWCMAYDGKPGLVNGILGHYVCYRPTNEIGFCPTRRGVFANASVFQLLPHNPQ